jgi:hypothetical protein
MPLRNQLFLLCLKLRTQILKFTFVMSNAIISPACISGVVHSLTPADPPPSPAPSSLPSSMAIIITLKEKKLFFLHGLKEGKDP